MDKQSKAPGVYRGILCVLTLALAPVFYAIWQPYNTCLLQLPAAGGVWQLLTRLLYYVLFSLLLAGICRSSLGPKTVAPFGAKPWLCTVGGVTAAYEKQAVWLVQDMVTGVLLYGVFCARFSLRWGNWTTGFRGFCIFVLRFEAVLLVAVFLCVAKVMVLPQGAVQSVYMVDSSVTRVERMAGYADLLTLFRESNGVEDLF